MRDKNNIDKKKEHINIYLSRLTFIYYIKPVKIRKKAVKVFFFDRNTTMSDPNDLLKAELGIISSTSEHHHHHHQHQHHHHEKVILPSAEATKMPPHKLHPHPDQAKGIDHKEEKPKHEYQNK